jgi:dUTP pyrophosphatase
MTQYNGQLKIFKTHSGIVLPKFGTEQAACFDLAYQPHGKHEYVGYNVYNKTFSRPIKSDGLLTIMPGDRIMVPTGLIFDIPEGHSLRIHPRSGLSYKQGLVLANLEAVIDSDYVHETFVLLTNLSENPQTISVGDRIAQAELIEQLRYDIVETAEKPEQKTDRVGGLGSTGVATIDTSKMNIVAHSKQQPVKRGRGRPKSVA